MSAGDAESSPGWVEISLELEPELVEPAAELLAQVADGGVAIEPAGGKMLVRAWLPQDQQLTAQLDRFKRGVWHLGQITPFPEPAYRELPQQDWESAWKRQYRPLPIGQRLLVQPVLPGPGGDQATGRSPWNDAFELIGGASIAPGDPVEQDQLRGGQQPDTSNPDQGQPTSRDHDRASRLTLYLEPGMAFGTGTHPTTRQCLELLEERVRPGDTVLDVGCGSGILSIAAVLLGAGSALALDIDQDAVQLARTNAEHNQLSDRVTVRHGSWGDLPSEPVYEVIVANIQANAISQLLRGGLGRRLSKGGSMIVSGVLDDQQAEVERVAQTVGLAAEAVRADGDWRTLVLHSVA